MKDNPDLFANSPALSNNLRKLPGTNNSRVMNLGINPDAPVIREEIVQLNKNMESIFKINESLIKRINELECYTDDLYDFIESNSISINNLQAYSRRENIEIVGIPDSIGINDLESKVIDILASIGVKVTSYQIASCHRLKKDRYSKSANVIVRFLNRKNVFKALSNAHRLKNSVYKTEFGNNIYIRENLCPTFKKLFNKCYALFIKEKISSVYSHLGMVYIKIDENDKPINIFSLDQFQDIKAEIESC